MIAAALLVAVLLLPVTFDSLATQVGASTQEEHLTAIVASGSYTHYLPIVSKDPPQPQVVANVPLPGARCPYAVDVNPTSGYVYVANHESGNVTVLSATTVLATVPAGAWPTAIASTPNSVRTYVTNLQDRTVSVFDGASQVTKMAAYHEPYGLAINPVNGYLYVTNPFISMVQVFNDTTALNNLTYDDGWILPVATHPHTGLTYAGGWEHGKMFVISGTQKAASFDVGWGPHAIAIDPNAGYVYVANRKNGTTNTHYSHNLAVISGTNVIATFTTSRGSTDVAVDPASGYVYATNERDNTVTVLRGTQLVDTLPVGRQPWAVAVNPNTGYAFVVNRGGNSITILRHGAVVATLPAGREPFDVAVNPVSNHVYVVNRAIEEWIDKNDVGHFICHPTSVTILR
jgi:YVTN family beta-propeller protein